VDFHHFDEGQLSDQTPLSGGTPKTAKADEMKAPEKGSLIDPASEPAQGGSARSA
jgi:hypothetical protein